MNFQNLQIQGIQISAYAVNTSRDLYKLTNKGYLLLNTSRDLYELTNKVNLLLNASRDLYELTNEVNLLLSTLVETSMNLPIKYTCC